MKNVIEHLTYMGKEIFKLSDAVQLEEMSEAAAKKIYYFMLREAESYYKDSKDKNEFTFLAGCIINIYYGLGLSETLGRFAVDDICESDEDKKIRQYVELEEQFIYEKLQGSMKLRVRNSILGRKRFEELEGEMLENQYNPERCIERMLVLKPKFQFANVYAFIEDVERYFYSGGRDKDFVCFVDILDKDLLQFVLGLAVPTRLINKSQEMQLPKEWKDVIVSLGIPRIEFIENDAKGIFKEESENCNEVISGHDTQSRIVDRLGMPYVMTYDKEMLPNLLWLVMEQNYTKKTKKYSRL